MGRRSSLRNASEFALARSVLFGVKLLPAAMIPPVSRLLGRILHRVLGGRRRVVRENVRLAFGDGDDAPDPETLSRASFASLCRSFIELEHVPRTPEAMKESIVWDSAADRDRVLGLLEKGPVVFAASHFGAYEVGGLAGSLRGIHVTTLARPLDNPWLERHLDDIRQRFGQRVVSNRGGARELAASLGSGRSVVILIDLNQRRKGGAFVDFFGHPASTATTAAQLALRFRRPMINVYPLRTERPMHFRLAFGEALWPDPEAPRARELLRLMQGVTTDLEARVRETPDQWLWTHRRWKTRPPDEASS